MPKIAGIDNAFKSYGATLVNRQWAVSAVIDGAVVMSLWQHKFKQGRLYKDELSRWSGHGNNLFRQHLQQAWDEKLPVRLVVAVSSDPAAIDRGEDASDIPKHFSIQPDWIGEIETFTGDEFTIRFRDA